jgi:hypothetical protein
VAISCTAWAQSQAPFTEGVSTMGVLKTSWRSSLAASALWALLGPAPNLPAAEAEAPKPEKPAVANAREGDQAKPAVAREREGDREKPAAAREREGARREGAAREGDRPQPPRGEGRREAREGERRERGDVDPRMQEIAKRRAELMEQGMAIKKQIEGLKEGQDGERRELQAKLEALTQQFRELAGPRGDPNPGPRPDAAPLVRRLEQIKGELQELGEAGKPEQVERLRNEANELMAKLRGPDRAPGRPEDPADVQRRLQHLRVAVENLHAAGLPDVAENVMRLTERLQQGEGRRPDGQPRPEGAARRGPEQGGPGVQDIRNEVQQMRREMQELREMLKQTIEQKKGGESKESRPLP